MVLAVDKINPQVVIPCYCVWFCGYMGWVGWSGSDGSHFLLLRLCVKKRPPNQPPPTNTNQPTNQKTQVAARLAGAFSLWRKFESDRRNLMKAQLDRLMAAGDALSRDTYEIVSQSLVGGS